MNTSKLIMLFAILLTTSVGFISCNDDDKNTEEQTELSSDEKSMLQFLREEEKLARDVYNHLSDLYNVNVFANIGGSEQKHIDFVLEIMDKYNVEDTGSHVVGEFNNPTLQVLYDNLIEKGNLSKDDAFIVGATIEDLDIYDMRDSKTKTDNIDLIELFDLLECGSRNHLRAFIGRLDENDIIYEPQYITQEEYDEVLLGSHESCDG